MANPPLYGFERADAGARYPAFKLLEATGEPGIGRLKCDRLGKHRTRDRKLAVPDVAVGPMVEEVDPLDRRKAMPEALKEPVGPGWMARYRGNRDLIGPHGGTDTGRACQRFQTGPVIIPAGLYER